MNPLLQRQIKKFLGKTESVPPDMKAFLAAVSDAYDGFDNDRRLVERSLDLSSRELIEKNQALEHEILERKKTEASLRLSETNYRSIFDSATEAIFVHDVNGDVLDVNDTTREMFGFASGQFPPQQVADISSGVPPYVQQEAARRVRKAAEGQPQMFEWQAKNWKTGKFFWVEVNLKRATIGGDERVLAFVRNITERKKAEAALVTERKQLLSIFEGIREVVYVADPETFELLYMNEPARQNWGEGLGQKCYQVLQNRPEPCPFCTNALIFGTNLGKTHFWEFQNTINRRWYRCIDKAIHWPDERMVRLEMAIDVTDQKRFQEELQQKLDDLNMFKKVTVGRELKMIELKKEINALSKQLGKPEPYDVSLFD